MGFRERVSIQFYIVFILQITAFMTTLLQNILIRLSTVIVLIMLQFVGAIALGWTLVDQTKHPVLSRSRGLWQNSISAVAVDVLERASVLIYDSREHWRRRCSLLLKLLLLLRMMLIIQRQSSCHARARMRSQGRRDVLLLRLKRLV